MSSEILTTKLYRPRFRQKLVHRKQLIDRLERSGNIILICAPAGFGKTTLISRWIEGCKTRSAWFSVDRDDNDPVIFLSYLSAALRSANRTEIDPEEDKALAMLQSPQVPDPEEVLRIMINGTAASDEEVVLIIDDFHLIQSEQVHRITMYLLEHLPGNMRLVISTREDTRLKLARFRVLGQLTEIRAEDLRFSSSETEDYLLGTIGFQLPAGNIENIKKQTEGWIAGLQLTALSMRDRNSPDPSRILVSRSNSFVSEYLLQEVLHQQPEQIQDFLLKTSLLDRFCASLCEAVLHTAPGSSRLSLKEIEERNLFIVPLDDDGKWYRYHHLFREALQRQLHESLQEPEHEMEHLQIRASRWFENNQLYLEALHYAVRGKDFGTVERLVSGNDLPFHSRRDISGVLNTLISLPEEVFTAHPALQIDLGTLTLVIGNNEGVKEHLDSAEAALLKMGDSGRNRDLLGRIAAARSTLAFTNYQFDEILHQSGIALEYLGEDNVTGRITALWTRANALEFLGRLGKAKEYFGEALSLSTNTGSTFFIGICLIGNGRIHEFTCEPDKAVDFYQRGIAVFEKYSHPVLSEAYLGLARIHYQWNHLDTAWEHTRKSLELTKLYGSSMDRFIVAEVFQATIKLARNEISETLEMLENTAHEMRRHNFLTRNPEIISARILLYLKQNRIEEAAEFAADHELPLCRIRIRIAQRDPDPALEILRQMKKEPGNQGNDHKQLCLLILEAAVLKVKGEVSKAAEIMKQAIVKAEPGGYIRLFVDEGEIIREMLKNLYDQGFRRKYTGTIISAFDDGPEDERDVQKPSIPDPLTAREQEILLLIARGLSNNQICEELHLALDTVKGHNRNIFGKLQAERRTEAVARARELGLLPD